MLITPSCPYKSFSPKPSKFTCLIFFFFFQQAMLSRYPFLTNRAFFIGLTKWFKSFFFHYCYGDDHAGLINRCRGRIWKVAITGQTEKPARPGMEQPYRLPGGAISSPWSRLSTFLFEGKKWHVGFARNIRSI